MGAKPLTRDIRIGPRRLNACPTRYCADVRFARLLEGHEIVHARELAWHELSNGKLLAAAEEAGFQLIITTDKNIRHQQSFAKRQISLITLCPILTELQFIAPLADQVLDILAVGIEPRRELRIEPK